MKSSSICRSIKSSVKIANNTDYIYMSIESIDKVDCQNKTSKTKHNNTKMFIKLHKLNLRNDWNDIVGTRIQYFMYYSYIETDLRNIYDKPTGYDALLAAPVTKRHEKSENILRIEKKIGKTIRISRHSEHKVWFKFLRWTQSYPIPILNPHFTPFPFTLTIPRCTFVPVKF